MTRCLHPLEDGPGEWEWARDGSWNKQHKWEDVTPSPRLCAELHLNVPSTFTYPVFARRSIAFFPSLVALSVRIKLRSFSLCHETRNYQRGESGSTGC